jgi:hypothetical protein
VGVATATSNGLLHIGFLTICSATEMYRYVTVTYLPLLTVNNIAALVTKTYKTPSSSCKCFLSGRFWWPKQLKTIFTTGPSGTDFLTRYFLQLTS